MSFKTALYVLSTTEGLQMAVVTTLTSIQSINLHRWCIFIPFYLPDALIHLTNVSMCWSHLASLKESERDPFTPLQPSPRCLCSSYFSSWRSLPSSNFAYWLHPITSCAVSINENGTCELTYTLLRCSEYRWAIIEKKYIQYDISSVYADRATIDK